MKIHVKQHEKLPGGCYEITPLLKNETASCPYCETFQTSWKKELRIHINSKHGPCPPYKCNQTECSYNSKKLYLLLMHLQTHSKECKFHCSVDGCDFSATTVHKLKFHKSTSHNPERTFHCNQCQKQFKTKASLQTHMDVVHATANEVKVHLFLSAQFNDLFIIIYHCHSVSNCYIFFSY